MGVVTREMLEDWQAANYYPAAVEREFGISHGTIRLAEERYGIQLRRIPVDDRRYCRDYREVIQDMKPAEAVDYLLNCLDVRGDGIDADPPNIVLRVNLTNQQARIFNVLYERFGLCVSKQAIYNAMYFDLLPGDDPPEAKIVDVVICKVRQRIKQQRAPFRIDTIWGIGYRLEDAS